MRKSNKKGFTIVELVIVIAIIAILAAVLIPTFAGLIQKANESKDTQLVKNLNTALAADNKEHKTMTSALEAAAAFGYDVGKINASATGKEILWDSENDVFCYYDNASAKPQYIPETTLKNSNVATYKLWKIYTEAPTTQTFSIYWNSDADFTAPLTVGFDAGNNTAITALKYERPTGDKQTVVIRTLGNMCELTIYAPADHVDHYGYAKETNVVKVANASYHEFGTSSVLVVASGKVVVENSGVVFTMKQDDFKKTNDGQYISNTKYNALQDKPAVDENASIAKDTTPAISNNGGNIMASEVSSVAASETFEINNLAQLEAFRDATNSGETFAGKTINLNCDITLKKAWKPISNYSRNETDVANIAFAGIFNGNNHTIFGLTNVGLVAEDVNTGTNKSTPAGGAETTYGFFASVNGATIKNVTFADVKITNAGFGDLLGDSVGACVGFTIGNSTIEGVTVKGLIEGYECVGGILGRDKGSSITIKNCTNEANIFSNGGAAGIACRLYANNCVVDIDGCVNKGTVISNYEGAIKAVTNFDVCYAVGIADVRNNVTGSIKNCTNEGSISRKNPTSGQFVDGHIGQITIDINNKLAKENNIESGSINNS